MWLHVKDWYIHYLLLHDKLFQNSCLRVTFILHSFLGSGVAYLSTFGSGGLKDAIKQSAEALVISKLS